MTEKQNYSRSDLIKLGAITSTQIDYLTKLGVVGPDIGDKRKQFSQEEAALVIISGAVLRFGFSAANLKEPIAWLRNQLCDQRCAADSFWGNVLMSCNEDPKFGLKPLYVMIFTSEHDGWLCKWSNKVDALPGASVWQSIDLMQIFKSLNFRFN